MSTLSETYKSMLKYSQERRSSYRDFAPGYLIENGIDFSTHNNGVHLMVNCGSSGIIDFCPGTGKWIERGGKTGRGIKNLVKYIKQTHKPK